VIDAEALERAPERVPQVHRERDDAEEVHAGAERRREALADEARETASRFHGELADAEVVQVDQEEHEHDEARDDHRGRGDRLLAEARAHDVALAARFAVLEVHAQRERDVRDEEHRETDLGDRQERVPVELRGVRVEVGAGLAREDQQIAAQVDDEEPDQHEAGHRHQVLAAEGTRERAREPGHAKPRIIRTRARASTPGVGRSCGA
jgi:hypothetical protein